MLNYNRESDEQRDGHNNRDRDVFASSQSPHSCTDGILLCGVGRCKGPIMRSRWVVSLVPVGDDVIRW